MSASSGFTEWHLTPRGWERGGEKIDFSDEVKLTPVPRDRVLSYRFSEEISSMFSKPYRKKTKIYRSRNKEKIAELLEKFGECPESL